MEPNLPRLRPGPLPLGYRQSEGGPEPDPNVAPLVALCFGLLLQKGMSLRRAMRLATEAGLRSKRGKALSYSSFQEMVANPFYAGYVVHEGRTVPAGHEAIVDERTFWTVRGRLSERMPTAV